jgi:hypothetical protein
MPNIGPIPFFKIMLLCLINLTDSNTNILFKLVNFDLPTMLFNRSVFYDNVNEAAN